MARKSTTKNTQIPEFGGLSVDVKDPDDTQDQDTEVVAVQITDNGEEQATVADPPEAKPKRRRRASKSKSQNGQDAGPDTQTSRTTRTTRAQKSKARNSETTAKSPQKPKSGPKPKAQASRPASDLTFGALVDAFTGHLGSIGKSLGTCFSYSIELKMAAKYFGAETSVASLTAKQVHDYFKSDTVTRNRQGEPKDEKTVAKSRRVFAQALAWLAETGVVDESVVPDRRRAKVEPEAAEAATKTTRKTRSKKTIQKYPIHPGPIRVPGRPVPTSKPTSKETAMHILTALDRYDTHLAACGRSGNTRRQVGRHVRQFARWWATRRRCGAVNTVGHEDVAQFLASPQARTRCDGRIKKPTAMNALRSSLRTFFAWCHAAGYTRTNPARLVKRALCSPPPPRALSEDETVRLLAMLAAGKSPEAKRDHALFHTMLATGVRLGSALSLDVEDVDLDAGILHLRQMKGGRADQVFLGRRIRAHLRQHIGTRTTGPLFQAMHGGRLSPRHVQRRYRQWVERAQIARATSTHALRHTLATRLYAKTGDVFLVQQALCHRAITSTMIYTSMDPDRLRQALEA